MPTPKPFYFEPRGMLALAPSAYGMLVEPREPGPAFTIVRAPAAMAMAASATPTPKGRPMPRQIQAPRRVPNRASVIEAKQLIERNQLRARVAKLEARMSAPAGKSTVRVVRDNGVPRAVSNAQLLAEAEQMLADRRAQGEELDRRMGLTPTSNPMSARITKQDACFLRDSASEALRTGDHGRDLSAELKRRYGLKGGR